MSTAVKAEMGNLSRGGKLLRIPLSDIHVDIDNNARGQGGYDEESMGELQASIQSSAGILQPLLVTLVEPSPETDNKRYVLVAGFRRALCLKNLASEDADFGEDVPVMCVEHDTRAGYKLTQLIENLQRKDLSALELAKTIQIAMTDKEASLSQRDVSDILGISEAKVSGLLGILELPETVLALLEEGDESKPHLSYSHCRLLIHKVPRDRWPEYAKIGSTLTYGEFERKVQGFDKKHEEDEDADPSKGASQKTRKTVGAADMEKLYLPYFNQRVNDAQTDEEKRLWMVRADDAKWFLNQEGTMLGGDLEEYEAAREKAKADEEAKKKSESETHKFIKEELSLFRKLRTIRPEDGKKVPTVAEDWATVKQDVATKMKTDEWKARGISIDNIDDFIVKLGEEFAKSEEDRKKAQKAAKDKREEKKKEEAAKKAAEDSKKQGVATASAG